MAKQKYYNLPHKKSPMPIIIGLLCVGIVIAGVTVPVVLLKPKPDNTQKIVINSGTTKYNTYNLNVNQLYTWKAKNSKPELEIDDAVWSTQGSLPPYLSFDTATARLTGFLKYGSRGNFKIIVSSAKHGIEDIMNIVVDVPLPLWENSQQQSQNFLTISGSSWVGVNNSYAGKIASDYNVLTIPRFVTTMGMSDQAGNTGAETLLNLKNFPEITKINFETNSELSIVRRGIGGSNALLYISEIDFSNTYKNINMSNGSTFPDNNFFSAGFSTFSIPGNFMGLGVDPFQGVDTLQSVVFEAGSTPWPNVIARNSGNMWGNDGFDTGCKTFTVNREFEYFDERFINSQNSLTDVYLNIPVPTSGFNDSWMANMTSIASLNFHFLPAYFADWQAAFATSTWTYNTANGSFPSANLFGDSVIS